MRGAVVKLAIAAGFAAAAAATVAPTAQVVAKQSPTASEARSEARSQTPDRAPVRNAAERLMAAFGSGRYSGRKGERRAGFGWTNAHAKRVAAKKRRVKAHRSRK